MSDELAAFEKRFAALCNQICERLEGMNSRLEGMNSRMDGLIDRMDGLVIRMDTLSDRMDGLVDSLSQDQRRIYPQSRLRLYEIPGLTWSSG